MKTIRSHRGRAQWRGWLIMAICLVACSSQCIAANLELASPLLNRLFSNTEGLAFGIDLDDRNRGEWQVNVTTDLTNVTISVPTTTNRFASLNFVGSNGVSIGSVVIEIFEGQGGLAAERFINLSTKGYDTTGNVLPTAAPYYTDVAVHRVVDLTGAGGWIIQTGDAQFGNGTGGSPLGDFNDQFALQTGLNFSAAGMVAMANSGANTNDSQFFITDGPTTHLNGKHMIFGRVVWGRDTIDHIIALPTNSTTARPVYVPRLQSVEIVDAIATLQFNRDVVPGALISVSATTDSGDSSMGVFTAATPVSEASHIQLGSGDPVFGSIVVDTRLYIADGVRGLSIYSVANPATPQFLGAFDTAGEARSVKIRDYQGVGKVAFVADRHGGLAILNVNNPANITALKIISVTTPASNLDGDAYDVAINDNAVAFVVTSPRDTTFRGGLTAFDIAQPSNPLRLNSLSLSLGGQTVTMQQIVLFGDVAYVTSGNAGLLEVNISQPSNLSNFANLISSVPIQAAFQQPYGMAISGNRLLVTDMGTETGTGRLVIFDISTPPLKVPDDVVRLINLSRRPWQIAVDSGFAVIGHLNGGVRIFDVSSPTTPILRYVSSTGRVGQPFFDNGLICLPVTSSANQLQILRDEHLVDPKIDVLFGSSVVRHNRTSVDFGTLAEGQAARVLLFTIENDGAETLAISNVTVPEGFSINDTAPSAVAPGQLSTFGIRLNGAPAGVKTGFVEIVSNDFVNGRYRFTVTGAVTGNSAYNGLTWDDIDGNGVREPNEAVTVGLNIYIDANDNLIHDAGEMIATTDGTGRFGFSELPAGSYRLRWRPSTGMQQTFPADNASVTIVLAAGQTVEGGTVLGVRAIPGSVLGRVWQDDDSNGLMGAAEQGLAGMTVFLDRNGDGTLDAADIAAMTSADGQYAILQVTPGAYAVRLDQPPGYVITAPTVSAEHAITVGPGATVSEINFGIHPLPGEIRGTVWLDTDENGQKDSSESGLAGIRVYLDENNNEVLDGTEAAITIPMENGPDGMSIVPGRYRFTNVPAANHTVRALAPLALARTKPQGQAAYNVTVPPNGIVEGIDFGYGPTTGVIEGMVWDDQDMDGVRDPGEPGLSNVTVSLYLANNDERFDFGDGDATLVTQPVADGHYRLAPLAPSTYWLELDEYSAGTTGFRVHDGTNPVTIQLIVGESLAVGVDFPMTRLTPVSDRLIIRPGWNLVSLAIRPADPTVESVLSGVDPASLSNPNVSPIAGLVWESDYVDGAGRYRPAQQMVPLVGYWLYAVQGAEIVVNGYPITNAKRKLFTGWNLIGSGSQSFPVPVLAEWVVWRWSGVRFGTVDDLQSGFGYWLYSPVRAVLDMQ